MALTRDEWLEKERQAEAAQQVRFDGLTRLAIDLSADADEAEANADALAKLPAGDPGPQRAKAERIRRAVELVEFVAGRLDRVHLLQQPVPYRGARFGQKQRGTA
ncbi:hypothetical protein [Methylobacterium sp. JK268]